MRKVIVVILLSLWVLSTVFIPHTAGGDLSLDGDISFQPNIIPFLNITDRPLDKPESFRFEWLGNRFDIELFFNATYEKKGENITRLFSLRDFEDDFNVTVNYIVNKNESMVQFGWFIEDVENVSGYIHNAWFKIEDSSFDYQNITLEEIDTLEGYNITRFHLPDNLVLSFEDLYHKGFIIGHQNKTSTSVKGFSGKSRWDLDPITFSGGIITVIGGSEGSELDFIDIWNEHESNGTWNVMNNTCNTQFKFWCKLVFGNDTVAGTTWFADEDVQIYASSSVWSASYQIFMKAERYAYIRLGKLISASDKTTENGVSIMGTCNQYAGRLVYGDSVSDIELYGCQFSHIGSGTDFFVTSRSTLAMYECSFDKIGLYSESGYGTFDVYRFESRRALYYGIQAPKGTFDDIFIHDLSYGIYIMYGWQSSVSNLRLRDCSGNEVQAYSISSNFYLVNPDFDAWTFRWLGTSTAEVYRQYEFDLTFTFDNGSYAEGTNVTVSNSYLGTSDSWILTANGSIPEQTYSMGHYNQTGGNTIYDYNPYNITATLDGYQTYSQLINVTQKEDLTIALQPKTGFTTGFGTGFIIALMIGLIFVLAGIAVKTKKRN